MHFLSFAALVWLWRRVELGAEMRSAAVALLLYASYRGLVFLLLAHLGALGGWSLLLVKLVLTSAVAASTLLLYSSLQTTRELNNHHYR